jgi:uncharacterized membrane protein YqiK
MKVSDSYTNKEINRNFQKFQKAAILFGIEEQQNHNFTCNSRKSGKIQSIYTNKKKLIIWDDETKLTVQQKNLSYEKHRQTKTIDNESEYKHRKATAKREIRKRHRKSWEQYHTENLTLTK